MATVPARPGVLDIAAYIPGEARLPGVDRVIRLASNEAALGPSPHALEAARKAAATMHRYPESSARHLREALSGTFDLEADRLIIMPGSESLLDLTIRCFAGPGDEVLFPALTFPLYRIIALAAGATPVEAEAPDYTADVDALLGAVTDKTRVVVVANPNNPTGTWLPLGALRRLREGLPETVLLIIDSAYAEYPDDAAYGPGDEIVRDHPDNTIMTRTFSKMFALANLRVGWGYAGAPILDVLNRVRLPFCVTSIAEAAACAALADQDHWHRERDHCRRWRGDLEVHLRRNGFAPVPGAGNFVFVPVPEGMGGFRTLDDHLKRHGVITRAIPPAGGLRIGLGTDEENAILLDALSSFQHIVTPSTPRV